jgi:hypothetical protein
MQGGKETGDTLMGTSAQVIRLRNPIEILKHNFIRFRVAGCNRMAETDGDGEQIFTDLV